MTSVHALHAQAQPRQRDAGAGCKVGLQVLTVAREVVAHHALAHRPQLRVLDVALHRAGGRVVAVSGGPTSAGAAGTTIRPSPSHATGTARSITPPATGASTTTIMRRGPVRCVPATAVHWT